MDENHSYFLVVVKADLLMRSSPGLETVNLSDDVIRQGR